MKATGYVTVAAFAVGAFAAGRTLGARRADPARVEITVAPSDQRDPAPAPSVRAAAVPVLAPPVKTHASSWQRVMHDAPEAAGRIHQAVITAMEPRRRAIAWKRCAPPTSIGRSSLVFQVDVALRGGRLEVHDAHYDAVENGVGLTDEVGTCIASQLAGTTEVALEGDLSSYSGQVEYRFTVDFGS